MSKCIHHPGKLAVTTLRTNGYCESCQAGIESAVQRVDRHVDPKGCFIWYQSANNWQPIYGTGCAHWVAHQLNIQKGSDGEKCLEGFTYRVPTLIQGMTVVFLSKVEKNDVWVNAARTHTGLVLNVKPNPNPKLSSSPIITIRHASSNQRRVADNDFATYFHGGGTFFR